MAGRPRAKPQLTPEQVEELARIGRTVSEIAAMAGVSESTMQRHFDTQLKSGRGSLRRSLRKAQVDRALAGSDTMLIWLGKQYLGQAEKTETKASVDWYEVVIGGDRKEQHNNQSA